MRAAHANRVWSHARHDRFGAIAVTILMLFLGSRGAVTFAQTCDPPGPPPRFGCWWSLESCEWFCAVCDPFGSPPRPSCHWDGDVCNFVCPGYTGVEVTVRTTHGPTHDAVVYVKLSSICTATGAGGNCGGSFSVRHGLSVSAKCQALAEAIASNCGSVGYAVTTNHCSETASFTVANVGCPDTQFAVGISNDPGVFDQSEQTLPDGESETTTGVCGPMPGPVSHLALAKLDGGASLQLTWESATNAQSYDVFSDGSAGGPFSTLVGSAQNGGTGLTIPMPSGPQFYLVAGRNGTCGEGSKY